MKGPTKARPHSEREVESSNSTANLFLNGRVRKAWMTSTSTPFSTSTVAASPPAPGISYSIPGPLRSPPPPPPPPSFHNASGISQGMRNPPSRLPHPPPRAPSTQLPVTSQNHQSLPARAPATDAAPFKNAGVNPQVAVPTSTTSAPEAALMSPVTPGETLQHQQQLLQQLNDASSISNNVPATTAITIPATAATTTTGDSINPFSGSGVSYSLPSPDPSNPSHPSPSSAVDKTSEDLSSRVVPSPAVGPAQAHSPQQQNSPRTRDAPLPSNAPTGGRIWDARIQPSARSNAVAIPQQHVRRESAHMTQSQSPPSLMPAPAPPVNNPPTQPEAVELKVDDSFWIQSQIRAESFSEQSCQENRLSEAVELPRVRLLRDACISRDLLYLAFHQMYCFSTLAPSEFASLPEFAGQATSGLRVLEQLLVENQCLSVDFLGWCVNFPCAPQVMVTSPQYRAAMQQVPHCLALFDRHWTTYDSRVRARGYPPLVDELVVNFGVTSSVMLSIIFIAMCRRLYGCRHELQLRNLWLQNKHNYNTRFTGNRSPPPEQMQRENEQLIQAYLSLNPMRTNSPRTVAVPAPLGSPQLNNPVTARPLFTATDQQNLTQPHHFVPPPRQVPHLTTPTTMIVPGNQDQATRPVPVQTGVQQPANMNYRGPAPGSNPTPHARAPNSSAANQAPSRGQATNPYSSPYSQGPAASRNLHPTLGIIQQIFGSPPALLPSPNTRSRPAAVPATAPTQQSSSVPPHPGQARANNTAGAQGTTRARAENGINRPARQSGSAASGSRGLGARSQQGRQISYTTFLPAPGFTPAITVRPNPLRVGLHQAHLRDPMLQMVREGPNGQEETELFQFLHHFKVGPIPLGLVECAFNWQFSLTSAECGKLPRSTSRGMGQRPLRVLREGNQTHRIRCIKVPPKGRVNPDIWNVAETVWPSVLYIFVNDVELFVRRKMHNGKDLPLDITDYLQEGVNTVSIHLIRSAAESKDAFYVAGVEVLEIAGYSHVRRLGRLLPPPESRAQIQQRLTSRAEDEELSIVNDDLTVNLVDPFMARIFDLPARGDRCAHQECFDRDTFLMTRASKSGIGPMKDNWRCPICGEDVRPQNLIVDGFLVEVQEELRQTNRLDDARAIQIRADGSWELKTDKDAQSIRQPEEHRHTTPATATATGGDGAKRKHSNITSSSPFPQRLKTEAATPGSSASVGRSPQSQTPEIIELD